MLIFAIILATVMLLQSAVTIFLGVRASIRQDVYWATQVLQHFAAKTSQDNVLAAQLDLTESPWQGDALLQLFICMDVEPAGKVTGQQIECRFSGTMRSLVAQAQETKTVAVDFVGNGWPALLAMSESAILAVPVANAEGQVVGSITAERSLLPIYSGYRQDVKIVLCYLLVNMLLFTILFFFKIEAIFFRPLNKLVHKAEAYHHDDQHLNLTSDDKSPFRKLSVSLNRLLKRIEEDNRTLRQNVCELEQVNRELTKTNDLVFRSEKLASVGRLSAGLAHEIGNPLSIVQGYVELLKRDGLSVDEKQQFSDKALEELDRITRLIRQLLDFAGPRRPVAETVSINALIKDVVGFVSMEKNFSECSISTRFLAGEDSIVADKDALRQVLINCLFNAVDATAMLSNSERKISIETDHEQVGSQEVQLVLRVQDNGTGIAEEQLKYVFDPFYTTKEVGRGTGLGLFVSNAIVEGLGGAITLNNHDPAGVEVKISFPQ